MLLYAVEQVLSNDGLVTAIKQLFFVADSANVERVLQHVSDTPVGEVTAFDPYQFPEDISFSLPLSMKPQFIKPLGECQHGLSATGVTLEDLYHY